MTAVKTHVVAFDTEIMDLTPLCQDPVDLLFGFQMGGVTVIVLLAIDDGGKPCYDEQTAQRIANMDIPCFACTLKSCPSCWSGL